MIVIDMPQNGDEWYRARAGVITASKFDSLVTTKGAPSKSAEMYILSLAGDYILGTSKGGYENSATRWGHAHEPDARREFSYIYDDVQVDTPGFIFKDETRICGCSPDGIIAEWGEGLEIKCPEKKEIHLSYRKAGKLPTKYHNQVQGSMYVTGFQCWWFMSYFPGLPPLVLRVERDDEFIEKLDAAIGEAAIQLAMEIKEIKEVAS